MGDHFGVVIALERAATGEQFSAQLAAVLDDAVVHDSDPLGGVRMGVVLGRSAVGGPACVADGGVARQGSPLQELLEVGDLAAGPLPGDAGGAEGGDAG